MASLDCMVSRSADPDVAGRGAKLAHLRWPSDGDRQSGNFTVVWDDCSTTTYTAGQVFVDKGFRNVHRAFNPGPGTTEVWGFYVIPKDAALIIPSSPPDCAS